MQSCPGSNYSRRGVIHSTAGESFITLITYYTYLLLYYTKFHAFDLMAIHLLYSDALTNLEASSPGWDFWTIPKKIDVTGSIFKYVGSRCCKCYSRHKPLFVSFKRLLKSAP